MKRPHGWLLLLAVGFTLSSLIGTMVRGADVARMTKEELLSQLNNPDVIVLDVRVERDWKSSTTKIRGALREDPSDVESWLGRFPKDKTIVLYCA